MYGYYSIEHEYFKMKEVAEKLDIKAYGAVNLFKLLREKKILDSNNQPLEEFAKLGYFKPVTNIITPYGTKLIHNQSCRVSKSGIEFIKNLILKESV